MRLELLMVSQTGRLAVFGRNKVATFGGLPWLIHDGSATIASSLHGHINVSCHVIAADGISSLQPLSDYR